VRAGVAMAESLRAGCKRRESFGGRRGTKLAVERQQRIQVRHKCSAGSGRGGLSVWGSERSGHRRLARRRWLPLSIARAPHSNARQCQSEAKHGSAGRTGLYRVPALVASTGVSALTHGLYYRGYPTRGPRSAGPGGEGEKEDPFRPCAVAV
jgi:hypothetical protein